MIEFLAETFTQVSLGKSLFGSELDVLLTPNLGESLIES